MEPKKSEEKVEVNEDAELDKELGETLSSIRAENKVQDVKSESEKADKSETPSETSAEKPSSPASLGNKELPADESQKDLIEAFKTPTKGKFESEESYNKRKQLADLVAERKAAKTPDEKKRISEEITSARRELSTLNDSDTISKANSNDTTTDKVISEKDEILEKDKARLRELGGATKEDIEDILHKERFASEVKSTLETFIARHPELQDEDTREVYFDFVDSNYNWNNKSGKELLTVLELARENMFKPSETIQERVLKAANVQEKVNAMQFPGGTIVKNALSSDQQKSVDELKATGMSEEKALELISE